MEQAHKTTSGKWKIKVYAYTDQDGKQHCKTFTAGTRKEAERLARQYKYGIQDKQSADITIAGAVTSYINIRSVTLSPTTIRNYRKIADQRITDSHLGNLSVSRVTQIELQKYVNSLVGEVAPKTVRNIYGLISSALKMYRPDTVFRVTMPSKIPPQLHTPTDAEIRTLLDAIADDRELTIAVLLGAFGPLRRSEICGLSYSDIDGNLIHVHEARVLGTEGWEYKPYLKTASSVRDIILPEFVIKKIGRGFGRVIPESISPDAITRRFERAVENADVARFRFHDLRHYCCSILHALGVADRYVMARGGWATNGCMRRVYQNVLSDVDREMQDKAVEHFKKVMSQ